MGDQTQTPEPWMVDAGRRLAALRVRRGWTQEGLALHAGCSRQTVCAVEAGRWPRAATLVGLARAFGLDSITLSEILMGRTPTPELEDVTPAEVDDG